YPDDTDLVNAYHALELAIERDACAPTDAIFTSSPLPKNRMKVCLALFESKGVILQEKRGRYRLLRSGLTRDQLEGISQSARLRSERSKIRQQQMREFSGTTRCRWDFVLGYFDDTSLADRRCGHCDNRANHSVDLKNTGDR
ncbi:MAG: ATP-dependent helicase RecQ, partial [Planctomycetaceae bacterium]|nr:ATP-dependent helicase RecQ [Planctomycetaceae bacterium]